MKKVLIPLLIISGYIANSQEISGAMQFAHPVNVNDSNRIALSYSNLFYFRDYEYFNNIQTGYTLFGTWQYPRLSFQPSKWIRLEAGALLQKQFGDVGLEKALPMFSVQLQKNSWKFIFGALESNQSHQLIEPLMQYDQVIERPLEEGFQFKLNKKRIQTDIWLDWERRQTINADYSEALTGGLSASITLTNPGKPFQVKIPIQLIMPHQGGQLDTNSSIVTTVLNSAAGLWMERNASFPSQWLQQIRADGYLVGYNHYQKSNLYPFENGHGTLINFFMRSKWGFNFLATYWNGYHYIAPKGGKLFQSISSITTLPDYTEPKRELLFLNLLYEKEIFPGFFIDGRYTPVFDLHHSTLEHSFLLLFSYRKDFNLVRLKNKQD